MSVLTAQCCAGRKQIVAQPCGNRGNRIYRTCLADNPGLTSWWVPATPPPSDRGCRSPTRPWVIRSTACPSRAARKSNTSAPTAWYGKAGFREFHGYFGVIGNKMCDPICESWYTVFSAVTIRRCCCKGSPVLGFTSKRGKLLLDTSKRIRCPLANTLAVGYKWISTS